MFKIPSIKTPVLYQGITTELGMIHTERAITYGTHIVAGISKDRMIKDYQGIPVFSNVREAVRKTKPVVSVVFSTPAKALLDVEEAVRAKIPLIICTTEHVPLHDVLKMIEMARKNRVTLVGPSSPGIIRVGESLTGTIPAHLFKPGSVGIIGRSSSLIYEAVQQLIEEGLGVSCCVSLGATELIGTPFSSVLEAMLSDKKTKAILAIGQLSGEAELDLAQMYKKSRHKKPLIVYIPGQTWPEQLYPNLLGAGPAIPKDIIQFKKKFLEKAGAQWVSASSLLGKTLKKVLPLG